MQSTTTKTDLYQLVTDRIVTALESGVQPWRKPWNATGAAGVQLGRPLRENGVAYTGINTVNLWLAAQSRALTNPYWLTWNRIAELGGSVRKGAKSEMAFYVGAKLVRDGDPVAPGEVVQEGGDGVRRISFLKYYRVFNASEVDDLPARYAGAVMPAPAPVEHANPDAAAFIDAMGAQITYGGNRAFYAPGFDSITLPAYASFDPKAAFYATAFHELVHWTKHESRLNRNVGDVKRWGDESYAMEELVAELGAAFLCADHGMANVTEDQSAAYLASWLKVLKGDNRAVFKAASWAEKAATFLTELATKNKPAPVAPALPAPAPVAADQPAPVKAAATKAAKPATKSGARKRPAKPAQTTYQITADTMIEKQGREKALADARMFAKADARRGTGDKFWSYVAVCIEQTAPAPATADQPAPVAKPAKGGARKRPAKPAPVRAAAASVAGVTATRVDEAVAAIVAAIPAVEAVKGRSVWVLTDDGALPGVLVNSWLQADGSIRLGARLGASEGRYKRGQCLFGDAGKIVPFGYLMGGELRSFRWIVPATDAAGPAPVTEPAPAKPAKGGARKRPAKPATPAAPAPAPAPVADQPAPAPAPVARPSVPPHPRKRNGRGTTLPLDAGLVPTGAATHAKNHAQRGHGSHVARVAREASLAGRVATMPVASCNGYDSFVAVAAVAKAGAVADHGLSWATKPGASVMATLPAKWVSCRVFGRTSRAPRDQRLPAAKYWPGGQLPAGVVTAPDGPLETGPIIFGGVQPSVARDTYHVTMRKLGWAFAEERGGWHRIPANDSASVAEAA